MTLRLIYRGTLASCNYACTYCPFAKHAETSQEKAQDTQELQRFVAWVLSQNQPLALLFTPWGEALVRRRYQRACIELSWGQAVEQVSFQTNLSMPLGFLAQANPAKVSLWCTYHPQEVSLAKFLRQTQKLQAFGISFSVGVVAAREHFAGIQALRAALPENIYLWLNALTRKRQILAYTPEEISWLSQMDPFFPLTLSPHASRGEACQAGESIVSVSGNGDLRRCHFIPTRLGNLYTTPLEDILQPRLCTRVTCQCFLGFAQLEKLGLSADFGAGILARIPKQLPSKIS